MYQKITLNANVGFPVNHQWALIPAVYYSVQHKYQEFLAGFTGKYARDSRSKNTPVLAIGIFDRWNDAVVVFGGLEYRKLNMGLSYDVNYSDLNQASAYRGGFELSLTYIFARPGGIVHREVTCPIF